MDRKKLIEELRKYKKKVMKKYKIDRMILFGSRANGKIRENSDVDLIVVGKFCGKNNFRRAPPLYLEWNINLPVDFLCYTPAEFARLKKRISIVREAVREGIEI